MSQMPSTAAPRTPSKWLALVVLAAAQFMIVLDVSIVNVALPTIERELHFSQESLLWVINGYTLMFGGFLLLGGRAADRLGRRRMFLVAVAVFATASLACGLATSPALLVSARVVQGLAAAFTSPAALSSLTVIFTEGRERNTALGVWGAVAGAGGAFGVLLGGVLTEELGWSWVFFVNVPIAAVVIALGLRTLPALPPRGGSIGFDLPGAVTATGGLVLLVYGLVKSTDFGWVSVQTIGVLAAAAFLLASFVVIESRVAAPLVPLRLFRRRALSASNGVAFILGASVFSMFFSLSLFMQQVLGYSALRTGLGYLSVALAIIAGSQLGRILVGRLGTRPVLVTGQLLVSVALALFSRVTPQTTYPSGLLPGLLIAGIGLGASFVCVTIGAVSGATPREAGVVSGLLVTSQQVGGALGVAVASTIAISSTRAFLVVHGRGPGSVPAALANGFSTALRYGSLAAFLGALVALFGLAGMSAVGSTSGPAPGAGASARDSTRLGSEHES
jgi:EmrB/QacA subfamily drug resistance transporter